MPSKYLDDGGYNGMIRDEASALLARGQVYDSLNLLYDQPGIARLRGGSTALVSGAQTAFMTILGFCYSQDATVIEELYGINGKDTTAYVINKTTGAATVVGGAGSVGCIFGRPVRHFGFVAFPASVAGGRVNGIFAGQTNATTFAATANSAVAAGNQQITLTAPDATTNIKVGALIVATDGGTNRYVGRVVSIDTALKFTVWPTPPTTFTATTLSAAPNFADIAGSCAASFQNRLLYGNSMDLGSASQSLVADRRIYYSVLPTESLTVSGAISRGATFAEYSTWPVLNYVEVPGADPIIAMEPIDDSRLLILTSTDVVILSGNLITQTATTNPSVTWDIYPLGTTSGCLTDLSVCRTPIGVMWAGAEGIFAYWPPLRRSPAHTGIRDLTDQHINTYWRQLQRGASFVIHGAYYSRGHYFISGLSGGVGWGLAVNVETGAWTRTSGVGTDVFNAVHRPSNPSQIFASRWWAQAGAAPSFTNGQTLRVDSMLDPYAAGSTKTDADGSGVAFSITTRVLSGDPETQKIMQRATVRCQVASAGSSVTASCQSLIDASDITAASVVTLSTISNTEVRTISDATNASPIVVTTTVVHGFRDEDFVDINAVVGNVNANGRYRIDVLSTTTFALKGSSGSGAYSSGGSVKRLTETDFQIVNLNQGQGVSFLLAGTVNHFELHGIRVAYIEGGQVMSA